MKNKRQERAALDNRVATIGQLEIFKQHSSATAQACAEFTVQKAAESDPYIKDRLNYVPSETVRLEASFIEPDLQVIRQELEGIVLAIEKGPRKTRESGIGARATKLLSSIPEKGIEHGYFE